MDERGGGGEVKGRKGVREDEEKEANEERI